MLYVEDLCSLDRSTMFPVCIDCICSSYKNKCDSCPEDTNDGHCAKCECEYENN